MKNLKLLSSILFSFVLIACSSSVYNLPENEKDPIISRTFDVGYATVFTSCLETLEESGWMITNTDKDVGSISTDYRLNDNILTSALMGQYRSKCSVRVKKIDDKKTKVTYTVQSEREKGPGSWEPETMTQYKYESQSEDFWKKLTAKIQ